MSGCIGTQLMDDQRKRLQAPIIDQNARSFHFYAGPVLGDCIEFHTQQGLDGNGLTFRS